jgi:hypothetical protein
MLDEFLTADLVPGVIAQCHPILISRGYARTGNAHGTGGRMGDESSGKSKSESSKAGKMEG